MEDDTKQRKIGEGLNYGETLGGRICEILAPGILKWVMEEALFVDRKWQGMQDYYISGLMEAAYIIASKVGVNDDQMLMLAEQAKTRSAKFDAALEENGVLPLSKEDLQSFAQQLFGAPCDCDSCSSGCDGDEPENLDPWGSIVPPDPSKLN